MLANLIAILPFLVITITLLFLIPAFLHWLWNITMIQVFALKKITYWESFRLFIICFLLIGVWGIILDFSVFLKKSGRILRPLFY